MRHTRSTHARTHTNRAIQLMRKNCLYVNRAEMGQTKKKQERGNATQGIFNEQQVMGLGGVGKI